MTSIGVMQGRLLPERLDTLQLFPLTNWRNELNVASECGFGDFELLYDKKRKLIDIMTDASNHKDLGLNVDITPRELRSCSVCLDVLSAISLGYKKQNTEFFDELQSAMLVFSNSNVAILVVPFCDQSEISDLIGLKTVLKMIDDCGLDVLAADCGLQLALELTLPADMLLEGFSFHSFTNIGICFDLGNVRSSGWLPENDILELDGLVRHVHIKDRCVGGPNVMLGQGDVDFDACFKALKGINYKGRYIMETRYFTDPIKEASANLNYLKGRIG